MATADGEAWCSQAAAARAVVSAGRTVVRVGRIRCRSKCHQEPSLARLREVGRDSACSSPKRDVIVTPSGQILSSRVTLSHRSAGSDALSY